MNELALFAGGGEESLQDICWGGVPCVPLKSKITHDEFYCNGKLMDSYLDSLSGTTSPHSTASLGGERSKSSAVDFPVRTSALQEEAQDSMGNDQDSGEKCHGSFAKYSPDTHSLRTHQHSLFEDSTECCVILPRWGLMRNGECWDTTTSVGNIEGKESGLLPTPPKNLFNHWSSAKAKYFNAGLRKSGVKVGSTLWWEMTKEHLHLGGLEDRKTIPDPSCGEVVMGWLMGWTELQPLEMDKFQEWQRQHGNY